jgi:hypothetical protein
MTKLFRFCLLTLLMLVGFVTLTIWVLGSYGNRTRSTRPIWSPNGRSLLFGGWSGKGTARLYQVNVDGTGLRHQRLYDFQNQLCQQFIFDTVGAVNGDRPRRGIQSMFNQFKV